MQPADRNVLAYAKPIKLEPIFDSDMRSFFATFRSAALLDCNTCGRLFRIAKVPALRLVLSDFRAEDEVSLCFELQVYLALSPSCSATVCRSTYTCSERILSPSICVKEAPG